MRRLDLRAIAAAVAVIATVVPASADDYAWSRQYGTPNSDYTYTIDADIAGNYAIAGYFFDAIDLGGGLLSHSGGSDIFVAKYDAAGNHVWSKRFGDTGNDAGLGVALDGYGNVYVTGYFEGTVDFGRGPFMAVAGTDIVLAKYDGAGNHVWSKHFGSSLFEGGYGLDVDATGNVVFTGAFGETIDFGGGNVTAVDVVDAFVAKYAPNGAHIWSAGFGDAALDTGFRVQIGPAGETILAGYFAQTTDFGGGTMTSDGDQDVVLAKYDAAGAHVWSQRLGGPAEDVPYGVGVDGSGNTYITGTFRNGVDFGGGVLNAVDGADIFLAKYDGAGVHKWSASFGGIGADKVYGLALDPSGNVAIAGGFPLSIDFGGGTFTHVAYDDVFVARFDPSGTHLYSAQFGGATDGDDKASAIAFDGAHNLYITGRFETDIDFGGGTHTSNGFFDIFVAKFRPPISSNAETPSADATLYQNHPNPFNPTTQIPLFVPVDAHVTLSVFDVSGARVRTLVDGPMPRGHHAVGWNGRDDAGHPVGSGVYFYRLRAGEREATKKMTLVK